MQPECQYEKKQQILFFIKYRSPDYLTTCSSERNNVGAACLIVRHQ
ncbi:2-oxoglutarate dehydrogenase complex [Pseudomonas syringae pv. actinidiae]|uniref:2-oxoglutarate dehydrogenase complex n=1 Tax=Pseudomonas syringae pv. actinidiae TaxID=103796 RepID=A0AAN4Q7Y9_PSESF|nr:2-oxoglutarate dehydrogenase complex [Pseudomonas syringae pv. actinidiae]